MFGKQKNITPLNNRDYPALMQQARAERARYVTLLFRRGLVMMRQLFSRPMPHFDRMKTKAFIK